ncbi:MULTISPECIES: hypothetical protein [Nostoc]|nr:MULTISPECIES: hypothetical protein [Nostoc]MBD2683043.1 hypothetical protein [Nostoc sp. FACHB-857]
MQVIQETPNQLKLGQKVSRWLRLLCILVAGIGFLLLIAGWRLEPTEFDTSIVNFPTSLLAPSQVFKRLFIAVGSVCIIAGLFMGAMIRSSITCIFDKSSGNLTIEYSTTNIVHQPLAEIVNAVVEAWEDTYRVNLLLAFGKSLPLTFIYSSGHRDKQELVNRIRKFLGLVS